MSASVLNRRLRELVYADIPEQDKQSRYCISEEGRDLTHILMQIKRWVIQKEEGKRRDPPLWYIAGRPPARHAGWRVDRTGSRWRRPPGAEQVRLGVWHGTSTFLSSYSYQQGALRRTPLKRCRQVRAAARGAPRSTIRKILFGTGAAWDPYYLELTPKPLEDLTCRLLWSIYLSKA